MYIPRFMKTDSVVQNLLGRVTHTESKVISYGNFHFFKIRKVG
jgi:hypothetical protein